MQGYVRNRKSLEMPLMWGPFLLFLFFPMRGWSQSPKQPPVDRTKRAPGKARYKRLREQAFVLVGAGDIASCKALEGAQATAKLIEQIPGTVWAAGDLAYEHGSAAEFKNCYGTTWGKFKDRTRPALGNHEYATPGAAAYFAYWGDAAGS